MSEPTEEFKEACRIATWMANTYFPEQEFALLPTLSGVLSQIDNMNVGVYERSVAATPASAEEPDCWDEAIRLANSVECLEGFSGHWQNGHSQAKAVIIGLLTNAAEKWRIERTRRMESSSATPVPAEEPASVRSFKFIEFQGQVPVFECSRCHHRLAVNPATSDFMAGHMCAASIPESAREG